MKLDIQKFGGRGATSSTSKISIMSEAEAKNYKLTPEQLKRYNIAVEDLNLTISSKDARDYYIKSHAKGFENRPDYQEILEIEGRRFDTLEQDWQESYSESLKEAKEKNITLTMNVSSSTLRALEKKGLIKIISDGGKYVDKIKILKRK